MKIPRNNFIILFCLVVFGAIIRFWGLGSYQYHVDEKFTIELVAKPLWDVIVFGLSQDCNPPLFYFIDWFSVHAFGFNAFAQRLPATIFGIACIPATYLLGKELRDDMVGLLSAGVATILGSMWYYSQFGRAYTLITLLFTILLIFYIRALRGDASRRTFVIIGLLSSLCVWTHLYALIPCGLIGLHLLYLNGNDYLKTAWSYLPIAGLAGIFLAIITKRGNIMQGWMGNTPAQLIEFMPLEYFGYACGIFWPLIGISAWLNRKDTVVKSLLAVWMITFISQVIISLITPVFIRYSILMLPMLVVIAMEPVDRFIRNNESSTAQKAFILGLFSLMYIVITAYQFFSGAYDGRNL